MSVEDTVRATDTLSTPEIDHRNEFILENSTVVAEYGPVGLILRIQHPGGWSEYAGPMNDPVACIKSLSEVSR